MAALSRPSEACLPVLVALLLALGCVLLPSQTLRAQNAAGDPPARVGRLALIDGTVSYHTADQGYWSAGRRNFPVTTGEAFWTEPAAHAALDVGSDRIYLDSSTELDVSALDDRSAQFSLPQGAVFVALRSRGQGSVSAGAYEIDIARGVVILAAAGRYEIIAGDTAHDSQVIVIDGSARVRSSDADVEIGAGEAIVLSGTETIQTERVSAPPPNAFVAWVEAQERRLPREVPVVASAMTGVTELAAYGRWTRAERYGDVWYPNVPAGWAPYRNGYWGWVEPWGWTWVGDEEWGFAPFHYGR